MTSLNTISAAVVALAMSGGIAAAATATNAVNIRSEPSAASAVIGVIPAGAPVETLGCNEGWCKVNHAGRVGFASAAYLAGDNRGAAMIAPRAPAYQASPLDSYAYDGPSIGFSFGDRWW